MFTTARLITVNDDVLLQFTITWLLQFSSTIIHNLRQVLAGITIYDDCYYNLPIHWLGPFRLYDIFTMQIVQNLTRTCLQL